MIKAIIFFAIGLIMLIKGGDWFVDGSSALARRFHVPELLMGATVVSVGTTLPEVMVSAQSAISGHGEMAYGNAIGSIICNTALITALVITVHPAAVARKTLVMPVGFFFAAALIYMGAAYMTGYFSRATGILLLAVFVIYITCTLMQVAKQAKDQPEEQPSDEEVEIKQSGSIWKDVAKLVTGAVLIAFGAKFLVDNGTIIASNLGVPESVIALTLLALGTSLPELVTAITSLAKGLGVLSLGNIIGANLFNLVLVSGIATSIAPFEVPSAKMAGAFNASLVVDLPVMLLVMIILTIPTMMREKLSRVQGITLLVTYAAFLVSRLIYFCD